GRRGHRGGGPSRPGRGGWSWGHSRALRRCTECRRTRARRPRSPQSGVGPSRRASRRTSVSLSRFWCCRSWVGHHGIGSSAPIPWLYRRIHRTGNLFGQRSLTILLIPLRPYRGGGSVGTEGGVRRYGGFTDSCPIVFSG